MRSNKELRRLRAIVETRRLKAEIEVAQISRGIISGSRLREELEATDCGTGRLGEAAVGYVTRTMDILDRGLGILRQQQSGALAKIDKEKETARILGERERHSFWSAERRSLERELIESAMRRKRNG